jgi:UDP-N-acetylglucosamine--N-acetylmuramyl-(pentapeptide) pyrophosphoryl-undecaprenol N-acetylglucosamine transferase
MTTIVIAGGGTGGHVYPGLAVAKAIGAMCDANVVFVGTARGVEARVVPAAGYALETLDVQPMKGGGAKRFVRGGITAARSMYSAASLIRKLKPKAVLSIGGYAAGPVALAGALLGVPLALVEPNAVTGFTNRLLTPFAKRVYTAWDEVAGGSKERVFGVPIRDGFAPTELRAVSDAIAHVLVMGGSQGAKALNQHVPAAIAAAARDRVVVVTHQCGVADEAAVIGSYAAYSNIRVHITPFIADTAAALAAATLVIARAGASSVAEIAAVGRAAILVPLPTAADDHQTRNAERLAATGGAIVVKQSTLGAPELASALAKLFDVEGAQMRLGLAARKAGNPAAATRIARDLLELAHIEPLSGAAPGKAVANAPGATPSLLTCSQRIHFRAALAALTFAEDDPCFAVA